MVADGCHRSKLSFPRLSLPRRLLLSALGKLIVPKMCSRWFLLTHNHSVPKHQKAQPKSAADTKRNQKDGRDAKANNKNSGRGGRKASQTGKQASDRTPQSGRPVKKSVEELDNEMADYFDDDGAAPAEGAIPVDDGAMVDTDSPVGHVEAPQQPVADDDAMEAEIS